MSDPTEEPVRFEPRAPEPIRPTGGTRLGRLVPFVVSVIVILLAWAGPAAAKGPVPTVPEPAGPLTSGRETEIVVRLEWPGGEVPAGLGPETYDMWGDDLPWDLLAVSGTATSAEAMADADLLSLVHQGGGRYTAAFTPDEAGEWALVMVVHNGGGGWQTVQSRTVQVGEPVGDSPTRAAVGAGVIVVVGLAGAAAVLRRRGARRVGVPDA